jgi:4-oxalocrotonate tautomerase
MPLVRISLREGKTPEYRRAVADSIHDAMVATIGIPAADRFQVITEHGADGLIFDPGYLGIKRSDDVVFVQITLSTGRTVEIKKVLYTKITENLANRVGLRKEDVFVNLVEVVKENWSFGNGEAQYAG